MNLLIILVVITVICIFGTIGQTQAGMYHSQWSTLPENAYEKEKLEKTGNSDLPISTHETSLQSAANGEYGFGVDVVRSNLCENKFFVYAYVIKNGITGVMPPDDVNPLTMIVTSLPASNPRHTENEIMRIINDISKDHKINHAFQMTKDVDVYRIDKILMNKTTFRLDTQNDLPFNVYIGNNTFFHADYNIRYDNEKGIDPIYIYHINKVREDIVFEVNYEHFNHNLIHFIFQRGNNIFEITKNTDYFKMYCDKFQSNDELKIQLDEKTKTISSLKKKLIETSPHNRIINLESQLSDLQSRYNTIELQYNNLQIQHDTLQTKTDKLKNKTDTKIERKDLWKERWNTCFENKENIKTQLDTTTQELNQYKLDIVDNENQCTQLLNDHETQITTLQGNLTNANFEIDKLKQEKADLTKQFEDVETELADAQERIRELEG